MEKQYDKKITWTIKQFSSSKSDRIYSDPFAVGGCKWHLVIYPKGYNNATHLSLFLGVDNHVFLPSGWRRHAKFRLTVLNQSSDNLSISKVQELDQWFDQRAYNWGITLMCPLNELHAQGSGFLLNRKLKMTVEVDVIEVTGKLDLTEETSTITEDINGFMLFPSQAKTVRHMFKRHPNIASDIRPKNPNLRTGYMSLLLGLIETMCQLPQEMSNDDLYDAYAALGSMKEAGFKLNWLEKKLDEVTEKKENEEASESGLQEMEEELKDMKQKCSDMEDLVEQEKAKVSAAKAPISFDDIA